MCATIREPKLESIICGALTWAKAKDEASIPIVAMAPPRTAVRLNPIESIKIPASGETKKVIPIESDPTRAEIETRAKKKTKQIY